MKSKYQKGQRIEFIARNECEVKGSLIRGKWSHYVGYVKQVRKLMFGALYVVIVAKSSDVYLVPERDIIGIVESKQNIIKEHGS